MKILGFGATKAYHPILHWGGLFCPPIRIFVTNLFRKTLFQINLTFSQLLSQINLENVKLPR